jgi:importin-7
MRARACWLYGEFGGFPFTDMNHLQSAINSIFENLQKGELPVRVSAAIAIKGLLHHEQAVNFLRPGLEALLRTFLKIMDEIEFDELVLSLKTIVESYEDEIAPFAIGLCQKLSEAYLRMMASKGQGDDED